MDRRVDPSESWQSGSRPRSYELRIHNVTVAELAASREMYDSQCLNFEDGKIVITRGRLAVLIYSYWATTLKPLAVPLDIMLLLMIQAEVSSTLCVQSSKHLVGRGVRFRFLVGRRLCTPRITAP
jgi:hypothetical protein